MEKYRNPRATEGESIYIYEYQYIACDEYSYFLDRDQLLTRKLLKQGQLDPRLKSSPKILYGHIHEMLEIFISQMTVGRITLRIFYSILYH